MNNISYVIWMLGTDCLQPKRSAIPGYMPVTLDVALGFKYGTEEAFQHFGKELQSAVQRFDNIPLTLCHGKLTHPLTPLHVDYFLHLVILIAVVVFIVTINHFVRNIQGGPKSKPDY